MLRLHRRHPLPVPTRGFTLVELLVGIAILAVIAGMAAPSAVRMMATNRIAMQTNEFTAGLKLARAEAIRRGHAVTLRSASTAVPGDFARDGWSVITDQNGDGAPESPSTTADGTVVREAEAAGNAVAITRVDRAGGGPFTYAATSLDADLRSVVVFSSRGGHAGNADAFFRVCDANIAVPGRIVRVSVVGNISLAETNADCS